MSFNFYKHYTITRPNDGTFEALDQSFKSFEIEAFKQLHLARTGLGKLIWCFLILVFSGVTIYECCQTVSDFLNSPVASSVKILPSDEMRLPQIYMCPSHRFTEQALRQNKTLIQLALALSKELTFDLNSNEPSSLTGVDELMFENLTFLHLKQLSQSLYVKPNVIFWGVQFRDSISSIKTIPGSKLVRQVFDPHYGICYKPEIPQPYQVIQGSGLTFFMKLQRHVFQVNQYDPISKVPVFRGLYVSVADQLDPTNLDKVRIISTGSNTKMPLHKRRLSFLPEKNQRKCSNVLIPRFRVLNANYSKKSCQLDCQLAQFVDSCTCLPAIDQIFLLNSTLLKYRYCTVAEMRKCRRKGIFDSKCQKACAIPCQQDRYDTTVSTNSMNEGSFGKYVAENGSHYQPIWRDFFVLQIFFNKFETQLINETGQAISVHDMIGNLGSQMNLWVGMSMFTLIQMPSVISFVLLFRLCQKYRHAKQLHLRHLIDFEAGQSSSVQLKGRVRKRGAAY